MSRQRREISLFMMALSVHQLLVFYERHVFAMKACLPSQEQGLKKLKHRTEWKTLNMGVVDADSGADVSKFFFISSESEVPMSCFFGLKVTVMPSYPSRDLTESHLV